MFSLVGTSLAFCCYNKGSSQKLRKGWRI